MSAPAELRTAPSTPPMPSSPSRSRRITTCRPTVELDDHRSSIVGDRRSDRTVDRDSGRSSALRLPSPSGSGHGPSQTHRVQRRRRRPRLRHRVLRRACSPVASIHDRRWPVRPQVAPTRRRESRHRGRRSGSLLVGEHGAEQQRQPIVADRAQRSTSDVGVLVEIRRRACRPAQEVGFADDRRRAMSTFVRTPAILRGSQRPRELRGGDARGRRDGRSPWRAASRSRPRRRCPARNAGVDRRHVVAVDVELGRPCRSTAASRPPGPRRRRAPRSRDPSNVMSSCVIGSGSPAATRDLQLDEVEAGDRLGHRVLDLQAGVDLEERDRVAVGDSPTMNSTVPAPT